MNTSTKTPKFRPYLSLEEITALITLAESFPTESPIIQRAIASLSKTKILAEHGIKSASYVTNPRKSIEQKLGFFTGEMQTESPDFDTMMESLTSANSAQEAEQTQETKESK